MKLPRRLTLTDRADFAALRKDGRSASTRFLVLSCLPKPGLKEWRYALVTSKKAGKAHERDRIRRLLRAVLVEEGAHIPPEFHLVFIARWQAKEAGIQQLRKDVRYLLRKLKVSLPS